MRKILSLVFIALFAVTAAPAFTDDEPGGAVALTGCSAAQKTAEADIAKTAGDCVVECGIELTLNGQEAQAPLVCGTRCLGKEITDPTQLLDLQRIVMGTKTAGAKAGVRIPSADAGK